MEEIVVRFPKVSKLIFNNLDDENITKCKIVSRSWNSFMKKERFFWIRIIEKYMNKHEEFKWYGNW